MTPRALGDESRQAGCTEGEPEVQSHRPSLSIAHPGAHPGNAEMEAASSPHLVPRTPSLKDTSTDGDSSF